MARTATNAAGEKRVLIGSDWVPYDGSATNPATGEKAFKVQGKWLKDSELSAPALGSIPQMGTADPDMPYLTDQFKQGLAGLGGAIVKGATSMPPPLMGMRNPLVPQGLAEGIQGGLEGAIGVQNVPQPKDMSGQPKDAVLGKIAQFMGAGMVPGFGVIGAAERPIVAAFMELAGSALGGIGAQEGKTWGRDIAQHYGVDPERGSKLGEILGSFFGVATLAKAQNYVGKGFDAVGNQYNKLTGSSTGTAADKVQATNAAAGTELKNTLAADPLSQQRLSETNALRQQIPGFDPNLAQASGAPGVIALAKNIQGQNPESLATAVAREKQNIKAIGNFKQNAFPQTSVSPLAPAKTAFEQKAAKLQSQLDNTDQQINHLSQNAESDAGLVGARLRELRDQRQTQVKAIKDAKYDDVYQTADKLGIKEDLSDVQVILKDMKQHGVDTATVMPSLNDRFTKAIASHGTRFNYPTMSSMTSTAPKNYQALVPFRDMHEMLIAANKDYLSAKLAGDNSKMQQISNVRDLLKKKMMSYEGPQYGDLATKLKDANSFFLEKYHQVFREGVGGRMKAGNKFGDVTRDDEVVRKLILTPNSSKGIEDAAQIFAENPEATTIIEKGVRDAYFHDVVKDGEISQAASEAFFRKYGRSLDRVPGVKTDLLNIDRRNDLLIQYGKDTKVAQTELDNSVLSKIAKADDIPSVINQALNDKSYMKELLMAGKDPATKAALARSIMTEVGKMKDPLGYVSGNKDLKVVLDSLGKNHYNNLVTLAKSEEVLSRLKTPTHVPSAQMKEGIAEATGTPAKSIISVLRSAAEGRISQVYAAMHLGGRFLFKIKTEDAKKALEAALYDPAFADKLVKMQFHPSASTANSVKNHMISHGIKVYTVESDNDEKDNKP